VPISNKGMGTRDMALCEPDKKIGFKFCIFFSFSSIANAFQEKTHLQAKKIYSGLGLGNEV
jgi:hypothetical protein